MKLKMPPPDYVLPVVGSWQTRGPQSRQNYLPARYRWAMATLKKLWLLIRSGVLPIRKSQGLKKIARFRKVLNAFKSRGARIESFPQLKGRKILYIGQLATEASGKFTFQKMVKPSNFSGSNTAQGPADGPWIDAGKSYEFHLYDAAHAKLLSKVVVEPSTSFNWGRPQIRKLDKFFCG